MNKVDGISRRAVLKSAMGAFAPLSLFSLKQEQQQEQQPAVGELAAPGWAGPGLERTTDWENDPYLNSIEVQLRCMCGCNQSVYQCRTTDFTCPLVPVTHRRLISMVEGGMDAQQIIDAFIAESGEEVLMAPTTKGFNLTAYFVPGLVIAAVGSALAWSLARRQAITEPAAVRVAWDGQEDIAAPDLDADSEDAIRREMAKLDL